MESLVSIMLLSMLVLAVIGAFFIAKSSTSRARHRLEAMNIVKSYIEQEIAAGYDGGSGDEADFYVTVTSAAPVNVTIDNRGTADTADDLIGSIAPDPYHPDNIENADGSQISYEGLPFKIAGFVITWTEDGSHSVCAERAVAHIAYHSSF